MWRLLDERRSIGLGELLRLLKLLVPALPLAVAMVSGLTSFLALL